MKIRSNSELDPTEVDALEVVARDPGAAGPRGPRRQHHRVVAFGELRHGGVAFLADVHAGLEGDALGGHEVDAALDLVLRELHGWDSVHEQPADAVLS